MAFFPVALSGVYVTVTVACRVPAPVISPAALHVGADGKVSVMRTWREYGA